MTNQSDSSAPKQDKTAQPNSKPQASPRSLSLTASPQKRRFIPNREVQIVVSPPNEPSKNRQQTRTQAAAVADMYEFFSSDEESDGDAQDRQGGTTRPSQKKKRVTKKKTSPTPPPFPPFTAKPAIALPGSHSLLRQPTASIILSSEAEAKYAEEQSISADEFLAESPLTLPPRKQSLKATRKATSTSTSASAIATASVVAVAETPVTRRRTRQVSAITNTAAGVTPAAMSPRLHSFDKFGTRRSLRGRSVASSDHHDSYDGIEEEEEEAQIQDESDEDLPDDSNAHQHQRLHHREEQQQQKETTRRRRRAATTSALDRQPVFNRDRNGDPIINDREHEAFEKAKQFFADLENKPLDELFEIEEVDDTY